MGTVITRMAEIHRKKYNFMTKEIPFKIHDVEFYLAWHMRYDMILDIDGCANKFWNAQPR